VTLIPSRFHRLPLRALTVFEAAARHGRFSAAANELLMTQAGVSQHIAQLETDLGVELFVRHYRGVQLTSAGAAFLQTVEQGLKTLADGVAAVRRQAGRKTLKILTDYGFAAWWLMPRLSLIGELLPGVEVQIATTQAGIETTDAEFDVGIMFGDGAWPAFRSTQLLPEEVYPVCSPALLDGRSAPLEPAQIASLRLLHLRSATGDRWHTWPDWFAAHDLAVEFGQQDLAFDNFQLVLQAALLGQGVCLGWAPLIDDLVNAGGLVRLMDTPLGSSRGYHLVEHTNRPYAANVATLKAWLLGQLPSAWPRLAQPPAESPLQPRWPDTVAGCDPAVRLIGA
jgi:LysR family glycine cleavage system transcriptional activator